MDKKTPLIDIFDSIASGYTDAAAVPHMISKKLIERLEDLHHFQPHRILDLGCGTGFCIEPLKALYPNADIVGVDHSSLFLEKARGSVSKKVNFIQGDIESLPFQLEFFDLITANLSFMWVKNLPGLFKRIKKLLKPDGLLLFTTLGIDTFKELSPPSSDYPWGVSDLHTIGDLLNTSQWQDVVIDVDRLLAKYKNEHAAYTELQQLGLYTLLKKQSSFEALKKEDYKENYYLTWEVIYGQSWNRKEASQMNENGEIIIPISQLVKSAK